MGVVGVVGGGGGGGGGGERREGGGVRGEGVSRSRPGFTAINYYIHSNHSPPCPSHLSDMAQVMMYPIDRGRQDRYQAPTW